MKRLLSSLSTFFLFLILFSSCAVHKYDYYYSIMDSSDKDVQKWHFRDNYGEKKMFSIDSLISYVDKEGIIREDTVSAIFNFSSWIYRVGFDFRIKSSIPVWIDMEQTRIIINDSLYLIIPRIEEMNFRMYKYLPGDWRLSKAGSASSISSSYLDSIYGKYPDSQYNLARYQIKGKEPLTFYEKYTEEQFQLTLAKEMKELPFINFTEENTPLHIRAEIVYYSDSTQQYKHSSHIELYQSGLYKKKNQRYEYDRFLHEYKKGEKIAENMADLSFYSYEEKGKIWGITEIADGTIKTGEIIVSIIAAPFALLALLFGFIPID